MLRRKLSPLPLAATCVVATVLWTGTTAMAAQPGVLETPNGRYEFSLRSCAIYLDDGKYDIELQGPGIAPDGEKIFIEYSSTAEAISVKLGVDQPYKSTDRTIKAGNYVTEAMKLTVTDNIIEIHDIVLMDENDKIIDGTGTLTVDCK